MKRFLSLLALALFSTVARGATQTFYQVSSFQSNVFLHDSPIALHLRISGMLTNVDWGDITGTITNQTDLQNALSAIPVVGVTAGTFYDGAQGDAVSNAVVWKTDTNGWVVSAHEAWLTAEVDPAYATGAVQIAGATMTGPMTNEYGFYGNGAGLTNLASDPSGWSGYAATQQVVWYSDKIADDTNYLVISGSSEPETAGLYQWANSNEVWAYWKGGDYVAPQGEDFWYILTPFSEFRNASNDPTAGGYDAYFNATGTILAAYGKATNTIPWRAGYDTNIGAWAVSRNGTNMQAWFPSSNVMAGPVVIGGVSRESWPSEYSDTAIYSALTTVSNWTIAGSNLAANALPTTGGTMTGPLTNEHGYFGDGSGLTNLPGSTPFDGTELSNSVVGLGILITNAAEQATNYADSVGSAVGLVASNALALAAGASNRAEWAYEYAAYLEETFVPYATNALPSEWTNSPAVNTLAITDGAAPGSVWVCTNANGSGELRQLGKMTLRPLGSEVYSGFYATNKWSSTPRMDSGDMLASENGITVTRNGTYLATMLFNVNGATNPAQYMRAHILLDNTRVYEQYGPMSSLPNQATISCVQSICVGANSGQTFGVQYYIYGSSVGQTNGANLGGHLSVVELP